MNQYSPDIIVKGVPGSYLNELALLYNSGELNNLGDLIGMSVNGLFDDVERKTPPKECLVVDQFAVGCKFSLEAVRNFLNTSGVRNPSELHVEHSWSLSNACGVLVNSDDTSQYKIIAFSALPKYGKVSVIDCKIDTYAAYCIGLYKKYVLCKDKFLIINRVLFGIFFDYLRSYSLSYSDLIDNPLLTGVILDFLLENKVYPSTYFVNLTTVRLFKDNVLPIIFDLWEFDRISDPLDERLIVPFDAVDFIVDEPRLSLYDSVVIINNVLRGVENVIESSALEGIEDYIDALLQRDNPSLSKDLRWCGLLLYYGVHRTAKVRVEKRPETFVFPKALTGFSKPSQSINMGSVENFLSKLQDKNLNVNIRRQFMGKHSKAAISLYKALKLDLPAISDLKTPDGLAYLNFDFYKHVCLSDVDFAEAQFLFKNRRRIDELLKNKLSVKSTRLDKSRDYSRFSYHSRRLT